MVKAQNEELLLLRGQTQASQLSPEQRAESLLPSPQTTSSGFSEPPPTPFTAGDLESLGLLTPSEVSSVATPSSGRGTWLCDRGTDPLYPWPDSSTEPPSQPSQSNTPVGEAVEPPNRIDSASFSTSRSSSITPTGEAVQPPNRTDSASLSSSRSSSTTPTGETVEPPNRSDSSSSLSPQLSSTAPSGVDEVVEQRLVETNNEVNFVCIVFIKELHLHESKNTF